MKGIVLNAFFTWNELHQRGEEMQQVSEQEAAGGQKDFGEHILRGGRHGQGAAGRR